MTAIVVLALLASAAVALAIVQVTTSADAAPGSSDSAVATPTTQPPPPPPATGTAPTDPAVPTPSPSPSVSRTPEVGSGSSLTTGPTTTPVTTVLLPGSGLELPSAWRGTADLTIEVRGDCAGTGGTSTYRTSADVAIDVARSGTNGLADPNPFLLTLGVNAAGVPGLALYSAAADSAGGLQRYWSLEAAASQDGRTDIAGRLIWTDPGQDTLLNLLDDTETDLQPCETGSTVGLPRALATGSTLTGWVDGMRAELVVTATTVDGQRAVHATVTATRVP